MSDEIDRSTPGDRILHGIIDARLVTAVCPYCDPEKHRGVVIIWAANAAEQLEAIAASARKENE